MQVNTRITIEANSFHSYDELREFHEKYPEFVIYHEDYTFIPFKNGKDNIEQRKLEYYHASYVTNDILDANKVMRNFLAYKVNSPPPKGRGS